MSNTISSRERNVKLSLRWDFLERIRSWRDNGRAHRELSLLLQLDSTDVPHVSHVLGTQSSGALHNACARSALLQWQCETWVPTTPIRPL